MLPRLRFLEKSLLVSNPRPSAAFQFAQADAARDDHGGFRRLFGRAGSGAVAGAEAGAEAGAPVSNFNSIWPSRSVWPGFKRFR